MAITEKQRHQLFSRAEVVLGPEEAVTMMELIGPAQWSDLATKADLDRLSVTLTRTFVTWLLASQGAFAAMIALLVSLAG